MQKALVLICKSAFILLSMYLSSCSQTINTPQEAGRVYCDCMKKNGSEDIQKYLYASKVCDGELIQRSKYYKIHLIDLSNEQLDSALSDGDRKKTQEFILKFLAFTNENCCEAVHRCPRDTVR